MKNASVIVVLALAGCGGGAGLSNVPDPGGADGGSDAGTVATHRSPVAVITAPATATTGASVAFSAAQSHGDSAIVEWHWDFGDGAKATSETPAHAFAKAGMYNVQLKVADAYEPSAVVSAAVAVSDPVAAGPPASSDWTWGMTGGSASCGGFTAANLTIAVSGTTITITEHGGALGGSTVYTGTLTGDMFTATNDDGLGDVATLSGTFDAGFLHFDGTYVFKTGALAGNCSETVQVHGDRL